MRRVRVACSCVCSRQGCAVCNVAQSTTTTSPSGGTPDRLVDFVVNRDGVLIALYNDAQSAVIKLKDVSSDEYADWHLNIRPEVGRRPRSALDRRSMDRFQR